VPEYAAIIFRRTYPDLNEAGAIMDRAKSWVAYWHNSLGLPVHWNEHAKTIWFEDTGARIRFAHLASENEKYNYQGAQYQSCAAQRRSVLTSCGGVFPTEPLSTL
jgi:hypothetical protein